MFEATRPIACPKRRWGGPIVALIAVLPLAALIAAAGCTAQKRYRVLSFFFDGVPDPNAPPVALDSEGNPITAPGALPGMTIVLHKPYADNNCAACHQTATGRYEEFTKLSSEICLNCHTDVKTQYPVMHGPVSAGECSLCHVPHESSIPHLLKERSPAVCTQCHIPELLPPEPPAHLTQQSCLDCHTGHGGARHGLLRPDYVLSPQHDDSATTREAAP